MVQSSIDGINYKLDLGEVIDVCIYLNIYEPDMTAAIQELCQPGFTVLDIGANIGAYVLRFAKLIGESGKVYAFEPTDYAYQKLLRNISLNNFKNISAFQIALANQNIEQQEINFRSSWRTDGKRKDAGNRVDFVRLDDWAQSHSVNNIDLIKLDVDGNEFGVISGGLRLIERCRPIFLMEAVGPHFEDQSKNPFVILRDLNYRFWNMESGEEFTDLNQIKSLFPPNDYEMTVSLNLIASQDLPT
jgi:FkbM family methyltransferase